MWIYLTHVTGLKIFKLSRQNPRPCQDVQYPTFYQDLQDPRSCQDIQDEIQDLPRLRNSRCKSQTQDIHGFQIFQYLDKIFKMSNA